MEDRTYRSAMKADDLVSFQVVVEHTDLHISASDDFTERVIDKVEDLRSELKDYIAKEHAFATSLVPIDVEKGCPEIVELMATASRAANVGPMAAVAGVIAELVGRDLMEVSPQVIVENGGDLFISTEKDRVVGIYAGDSPLSNKIGLRVSSDQSPLGICASSGMFGHSLSFGLADAVVVISPSTALADAAATALCNMVQTDVFDDVLDQAKTLNGISGVVIIKKEKLGVWGNICLISLEQKGGCISCSR